MRLSKHYMLQMLVFMGSLSPFNGLLAQQVEPQDNTVEKAFVESLFFTKTEMEKIRLAASAFANRRSGDIASSEFDVEGYLSQAEKIKQARAQERYYTYPQFYLESLVFHTDTDWSVWINGRKIISSSNNENDEIFVESITKSQVTVRWRPYDMERLRENFQKQAVNDETVEIQDDAVYFALKPNQTFSSYAMRVLEGKLLPVTVDNKAIEKNFQAPPAATDANMNNIKDVMMQSAPGEDLQPAASPDVPAIVSPEASQEIIGIYDNPQVTKP